MLLRLLCCLLPLARGGLAQTDAPNGDEDAEPEDLWAKITKEDWQPGRVGEHKTSVPMKDLECEGPQTKIIGDPDVTWVMVKERLHQHLGEPMSDPWLFQVTVNIQRLEPDTCVLGVTSTSAFLLPATMPKFRNMARTLNDDCNFLVLNVTFYDTLRSGFPIFGILDALATPEYRAWFDTEEGHQYFPPRQAPPSCDAPPARALREAIDLRRQRPSRPVPVAEAVDVIASGEVGRSPQSEGGCPLAVAAAYLCYALARAEKADERRSSEARDAALRDVIELVSVAEELLRGHTWGDGTAFGQLVATPWNLWWLLHSLQLAIPKLLAPWPAWKRPELDPGPREEL